MDKKHKAQISIIGLLIFVLPLIVVQCLFKWKFGISWLESEWKAGDLLGYIAGFETLLATTILSYVALNQTQQIKKSEEFSAYADINVHSLLLIGSPLKKISKKLKLNLERTDMSTPLAHPLRYMFI